MAKLTGEMQDDSGWNRLKQPCAWAAKCMWRGEGSSTGTESAFLGRADLDVP